jgi:hypothetical protein
MNRAAGTLFPLLLALVPALTAADAPRAVRPLLFAEYGVWCPAGVHSSQPWLHGSYPESAPTRRSWPTSIPFGSDTPKLAPGLFTFLLLEN